MTFFRHDLSPHPETQTLTNQYVPKHMSGLRWINIGGVNGVFEYPQHAGLSTDGQRFMLIEYDEFSYAVMDVTTQEVFWQSGMWDKRYTLPELTEWIKDGFVEIHEGEAAGRYRIFGISEGQPLLTNPTTGQTIEVDDENSQLILRDGTTMQELQRLPYRPSSDWTFASFSDDGSIIVAFANHAVTFFAPVQNLGERND